MLGRGLLERVCVGDSVKRLVFLCVVLPLLGWQGSPAIGQDKPRRALPLPTESAARIITKVPFNGQYYFIKIVPVDSAFVDRMPIYDPYSRRALVWTDSLQHLFPDSILKMLPGLRKKPE